MVRLLCVSFLVLATTTSASAQTASPLSTPVGSVGSIDEARRTARTHFGPFYVVPSIALKELGVDNNVFNEADTARRSDFVLVVAPGGTIFLPAARRALLRADIALDLVFYARYGSERSVNPQLNLRGELYAHRLTLFAGQALTSTRERPNQEIDLRIRHRDDVSSAGVSYRLTPKLSIEAAGFHHRTVFDRTGALADTTLSQELDRTARGFALAVRQKLTVLTTAALEVQRSENRFEAGPLRNNSTLRVVPGVDFKPRALIAGFAHVGFARLTPTADAALQPYSGLVSRLGLSYTMLGATTLGASYYRDVVYSYERTWPYFVDSSPGISVRQALGPKFDVIVSVDHHRYGYRDAVTVAVPSVPPAPQRVDRTLGYGANLGYRLGKEGRFGFGGTYTSRTSTTISSREYSGLRFGATFSYGLK